MVLYSQACDEEKLLGHLGVVLYEYLGEEYPEVLGSILGALKSIVNVIGMTKMTPPIKDLLPRLTPILKNRHEKVRAHVAVFSGAAQSAALCRLAQFLAGCTKIRRQCYRYFWRLWNMHRQQLQGLAGGTETDLVACLVQVQENCIDLVGRIADRGAEYVPAREWMRICFELLEMLKAHKKGIRRATVNTFGYIAKAIGPQVHLPPMKWPNQMFHTGLSWHIWDGATCDTGRGWREAAGAVTCTRCS